MFISWCKDIQIFWKNKIWVHGCMGAWVHQIFPLTSFYIWRKKAPLRLCRERKPLFGSAEKRKPLSALPKKESPIFLLLKLDSALGSIAVRDASDVDARRKLGGAQPVDG